MRSPSARSPRPNRDNRRRARSQNAVPVEDPPGFPPHLAIGSVGDGPLNPRADIRYIYLNGGPLTDWHTWSNEPGGRALNYIRNRRQPGMIPFFVFYNIPAETEGYDVATSATSSRL